MITRKIRQVILIRPNTYAKSQYHPQNIIRKNLGTCSWCNIFSATSKSKFYDRPVSYWRIILKDLTFTRLWDVCSRSQAVLKRWKHEKVVREVLQCFRQTFLRPRRTMLLSATAAYKNTEGEGGPLEECNVNIDDAFIKGLTKDFEKIEELSRLTLFCEGCEQRLIIDKQHPGVVYCSCKGTNPRATAHDGWEPYLEAKDVVIWKKEYKPGSGIYAYRVYGRYSEITAEDFACIQVDIKYRKIWDSNVAALAVVENKANGIGDQTVLHWEVLWPKFFSNRDYVYLRRHHAFTVETKCLKHKEGIFAGTATCPPSLVKNNVAYVIVSRSCKHKQIPERSGKVRVQEYWSHMVVQTLNGKDKPGMEYVLTYYDEPATDGMAGGLTSWATGRAVPSFLEKMRQATHHYQLWKRDNADEFTPVFIHDDPKDSGPGPVIGPVSSVTATVTTEKSPQPSDTQTAPPHIGHKSNLSEEDDVPCQKEIEALKKCREEYEKKFPGKHVPKEAAPIPPTAPKEPAPMEPVPKEPAPKEPVPKEPPPDSSDSKRRKREECMRKREEQRRKREDCIEERRKKREECIAERRRKREEGSKGSSKQPSSEPCGSGGTSKEKAQQPCGSGKKEDDSGKGSEEPKFPWCYIPGCWCGPGCKHKRSCPKRTSNPDLDENEAKEIICSPMAHAQCPCTIFLHRPPLNPRRSDPGHPSSWWKRYMPYYYFL